MIHAQDTKIVKITTPVSVGVGAATTSVVDTLGYDYCTILFIGGAMATGYSTLLVRESDASNMADPNNITNENGDLGFGESGALNVDGSAAADPDATNDVVYGFEIDLKARKRYFDVSATAGGTCLTCIIAILSRAAEGGSDVLADRGFTGLLRA
jgi:hypothetical protein